jgi:hypothetical protein
VPDGSTPQFDELDKQIADWKVANETATAVMNSLIAYLTNEVERFHIPHQIFYVQLSALTYILRAQMAELSKQDPAILKELEMLDSFVVRITRRGIEYQDIILKRVEEERRQALEVPLDKPPERRVEGYQ